MTMAARLRRSVIGAAVLTLLAAGPSSAFSIDNYNYHYTTEYPENVTCVSASAVTEINYIHRDTVSADYSHTIAWNWYNQARFNGTDHDKYNYNNPPEAGLDPRAWAWLLWYWSPPHYSYHDYWSSSQSSVDSWLMYDIRDSDPAAGAIVFRGIHAVDVIGFSSTIDPDAGPATLTGFYIADPWYTTTSYPNGNRQIAEPDGGTLGLLPGTWLSTSTWNASYFLPYRDPTYENAHGNTIWHGDYVAVLRTVDDAPSPSPTYDTMPTKYSDTHNGALFTPILGTDLGSSTTGPLVAITTGIRSARIDATRFNVDLKDVRLGRTLHVESLSSDVAPYDLAEVISHGAVVALAMLTSDATGVHLAGLQTAYAGNQLVTPAQARESFANNGLSVVDVVAAWAPSAASFEPFSPLYVATDPGGSEVVLTPSGQVSSPASLALP